jgi:glycosyltransferase involved in cell wall biosynthesis
MQEKLSVSVVMITYKHEPFIAKAIEGVLMQEVDFPVELIVADDCSPDLTHEIVGEYLNNHPKKDWIKYTRHGENIGMIPNFCWSLKEAKGKYIAICEGDDYWTDPSKLQKQVDFLESNPEYIMTFHNAIVINEEGELISNSMLTPEFEHDHSCSDLLKGVWVPTLTRCFRNVITDYNLLSQGGNNADKILTVLLGEYGGNKYMNNILPAVYRKHDGGVWSSKTTYEQMKMVVETNRVLIAHFEERQNSKLVLFYRNEIKTLIQVDSKEIILNGRLLDLFELQKFVLINYLNSSNAAWFFILTKKIISRILTRILQYPFYKIFSKLQVLVF